MYFGLSEEQRELAAIVGTLLERRGDSQAVRAALESPAGFDVDLWRTLCEQVGVAALAIPEEYDGAGFSLFETGLVLEELGRALVPSPLLATVLAAETLLALGDSAACARLLPGLAAGTVGTIASGRVTGGEETVTAVGDRLTGTVAVVLDGLAAEVLLVAATSEDGVGLFEVDPSAARLAPVPGMDPTMRYAQLTLEATHARRLHGDAGAALEHLSLAGSAMTGCLQLGAARRALEMTVGYSKERVQFGRLIGSFQALKHRMADMLVAVEMTRSGVWAASYAVASGAADAPDLCAAASSYAGDSLAHLAAETVQLHGGIAITWEHDAHLLFKRAHALNQLFGQPHTLRARLLA
ncbi:acyl-CoA dehydrogenase family protein [Nocardioides limicola]|uniref:acyl-CoA dehydrogenase family protein n=1 Tax=Nocardioides limicola TaxID=2803368 RepID=UPI00193BD1A5|nr:acyl-CoA dehydrogenase family protein [Nocardioides sp. DJM-14]